MNEDDENNIFGVIRTNKIGSECKFFITTRDEWQKLNEDERQKLLIESMWDSGVVDVFVSE